MVYLLKILNDKELGMHKGVYKQLITCNSIVFVFVFFS